MMKTRELVREHDRIRQLLAKTDSASDGDLELQSYWAQYVCIRVAGFMENALAEVYSEYARVSSNQKVRSFVSCTVSKIQNPNAQRVLETAGKFSGEWSDELESFLAREGRRDALNSIMTNRHQIAHGRDSDITIPRVRDYLKKCVEIVDFLERQCGFITS